MVLETLGVDIANYQNADDIQKTLTGSPIETAIEAQKRVQVARDTAISDRVSVTYETVMSHASHVDAMARAVARGFYVRLIFVTTRHADINVSRVALRVAKGGHDVPEDKIRSRYARCMTEGLHRAVLVADEAMIWDNSETAPAQPRPIAHVTGQYVTTYPVDGLHWPEPCLLTHLRAADYVFAP